MFYLVMELADCSLADFVKKRGGRISSVEAKAIVRDIAQGLKYLHELDAGNSQDKRYVHRDLKLLNVLQVGGVWKIADFGLSKALDRGTMQASKIAGTPYYMPPELFRNGYVSTKWDVWSLGVMIVEMLTGHFPFKAVSQDELERKIQRENPNLQGVSSEWLDIVKGCLKKDYKQRWTISQVLTAIEKVGLSTIKTQTPLPVTATQFYQSKTRRLPAQSSDSNKLLRKIPEIIGTLMAGVSLMAGFILLPFLLFGLFVLLPKLNRCNNDNFKSDKQGQIQCATEEIQNNSYLGANYLYRGNAKYAMGDKKGAVTDYTESITHSTGNADVTASAYLNRGNAKLELGDIQGAITDLETSVNVDPNSSVAGSSLAKARLKLNNKPKPSDVPKVIPDTP
jgi:serine/threonine protein kinase